MRPAETARELAAVTKERDALRAALLIYQKLDDEQAVFLAGFKATSKTVNPDGIARKVLGRLERGELR